MLARGQPRTQPSTLHGWVGPQPTRHAAQVDQGVRGRSLQHGGTLDEDGHDDACKIVVKQMHQRGTSLAVMVDLETARITCA